MNPLLCHMSRRLRRSAGVSARAFRSGVRGFRFLTFLSLSVGSGSGPAEFADRKKPLAAPPSCRGALWADDGSTGVAAPALSVSGAFAVCSFGGVISFAGSGSSGDAATFMFSDIESSLRGSPPVAGGGTSSTYFTGSEVSHYVEGDKWLCEPIRCERNWSVVLQASGEW